MQREMEVIDGSFGEGGGQILRTSLSLSMVTGKPFKMINIRAGRQKPGLLRQHLTSVKASAKICGAQVVGAKIGSKELSFIPGDVKAGDFHFSIGTAGSTTLVAQTVLPALMLADSPSTLTLEGGTHNTHAPPYDFLKESFLPVLEKMGPRVIARIHRYGFYPAGGGKISFEIHPVNKLKPIELLKRGEGKTFTAEALFSRLPADIAKRELTVIGKRMNWPEEFLHIREVTNSGGAGNIVYIKLPHAEITEVVTGFGVRGVRAEKVAEDACSEAKRYLENSAAVGVHLADQLLLPFALAGGGKFTTLPPTQHSKTNIEVIQKFTGCSISMEEIGENLWVVSVKG